MAFDNIKLEKGLYTTGKSFTQALEELDPSQNYIGTSLEGLDAYERQLKRFDIKVSGANSDTISKFFATTDSAALFPEYIARAVRTGLESESTINDLVATTTEIDSLDYRSIKTDFTNTDLDLAQTDEGEAFGELKIKLDEKLTKLKKHGKMLVASYEAIRFQKLDLFTTVLRQIGNHIARSEVAQLLDCVDDNKCKTITFGNSDIAYSDLINCWAALSPYNMNTMMINRKTLTKLLALPEMRDANAGLTFHGTGQLITPLGAKIVVVDSIVDDVIVAFDKNYAFEKVQAGGILTEFDKIIDRQLERATVSAITGFSTIYDDSICLLSTVAV